VEYQAEGNQDYRDDAPLPGEAGGLPIVRDVEVDAVQVDLGGIAIIFFG